ncbi:flagellar basal body-associated FliL family protein [Caulobacter sp. S45]|jgi:flagellar FliL protein|uniref:flagellar basal body-associated FliL family protein n=1 Tax=Caulobacter sp. S45 TaxID=1641861 RepID=UPI00131E146B|nr:flagellar basal body-associated FliL family protein [Caulobacter sp. S45]
MSKEKKPPAEAETDGAPEGEAVEGKKKLPMKLVIIGAAAAVVVLGGGGTAAVLMMGGGGAKAHAAPKKPAKKPAAKGAEGKKDGPNPISQGPDGVVYYTMPDMVVNIQSPDGRPTYLKLKLAFEVSDEDAAEAIAPETPRLNDMFQSFLRELRPDDLAGSQGSYQLRQEIQRRVNLVIAPAKVNAVLIQEMLVQ